VIIGDLFGISLKELERESLKKSTLLKQIEADRALAELKIKESRASRLGELDLVGSATYYNIERTLSPLTPSSMASGQPITTSKDIYMGGVTYTLPLFTGFAQTRDVEINEIAKEISDIKTKLTSEQLIYNIRVLYLSVLSLKEIKDAQHSHTKALQKLSKNISYEVKLGKKAAIDLLKSKSDVELSKMREEILKANILSTKEMLSALSNTKIDKIEPIEIKVVKREYDVNSLLSDYQDSLSKIKAEDLSLKKADKLIQKSKAANYPSLVLNSYYSKNYGDDERSDEWDDKENWQVGVNLKYNLLDFGKRNSNIQKAKIAKLKAKLKREQTLLDLKRELVEAIGKVNQAYAEYLGNRSAYKLSKKASRIERVRYENGVSTLNDYLLAKSKTQLALSKLIESRYNYQKSNYYIDYILERGVRK
jgi:outer membrane protein TolC